MLDDHSISKWKIVSHYESASKRNGAISKCHTRTISIIRATSGAHIYKMHCTFHSKSFFAQRKKKRVREKYEKWKISRRKIPFDMWEIFTHFLMQFWTTYTLLLLPFSNKQALMEMISTHVHSQKSWKKNFIFVIFISNKNCQESFTMNSQCRDDNALRGITLLFFSFSSLLLLFPCHVHQCHQLVLILNQKKNLFWHQCTWSM